MMPRTLTTRLGAALVASAFGVTSGITAMEVHQLAAHGAGADVATALERSPSTLGGAEHEHHPMAAEDAHADPAPANGSSHSGHPQHGSSDECTCVGPCATGTPPTLPNATFAEIWLGEGRHLQVAPPTERLIEQDPRSYLLPFPNAPPTRV